MKVLIAIPMSHKIANGEVYFTGKEWCEAIQGQDYPDLDVYILANDLTPDMESVIPPEFNIESIQANDIPDQRGQRKKHDKTYTRFADLRNRVLDYVLDSDCDYFVSIDSDVIVHPDMVSRLVTAMESRPDYGMIAAIVNNTRRKDMKRVFPRAIYNFGKKLSRTKEGTSIRMKPLCKFNRGAFIEVDYTGACMIINMKMLRDHPTVRWGPHKQGEDLYMAERIHETPYKIGVDTSIVTLHRMDQTVGVEDVIAFNNEVFI